MSIILPKPSKGIKFDYVFSIDMNDFDVENVIELNALGRLFWAGLCS